MANLKFFGTFDSKTDHTSLVLFQNGEGIYIDIECPHETSIHLIIDVDTAVQLSKHLRKEIAILKGQ